VTTTDAICNCGGNVERQVRMVSQRVQWTPLLLVVSMFACENTHSVALGLVETQEAILQQSTMISEQVKND